MGCNHVNERGHHGGVRAGGLEEPAGKTRVDCGSFAPYRLRMTTRTVCGSIGLEV
jgi:hypothetical protein